MTIHASMKRNMDQNVAPGESIYLTNMDFGYFFHKWNISPNQSSGMIRLSGNAIKYTGKLPKSSCSAMERTRYMTSTMYGI
jgi:hypothetical protein